MLAESAVLGAFLAQDLALFVAFFDLMLIPFYFLIGGWGQGPDRVKATIKLVIYTLVGSLLMLAAAIATGVLAAQQGGGHITFVLSSLQHLPLSKGSQEWIFLFFAAAFLVKMPAFPLHGWMPDGYRAMPIEVLMVFSGVLSKVGAYGFLAIVLPLFPQAAVHFQTLMLLIALVSIVYGSMQAFSQTNARLILGYSSVAQLGLHHAGHLRAEPAGRPGRAAADGQPRPGGGAGAVHRRAARAPRGRLGRHPRHGRDRLPRTGAGEHLPDRLAGDARDARLLELRGRVPDPAGRLQSQARDRDHRLQRRGDGERVRPAPVHPRDAQPRRLGRAVARDLPARRRRARAAGARDPVPGALPAAGAAPQRRTRSRMPCSGRRPSRPIRTPRSISSPAQPRRRRRPADPRKRPAESSESAEGGRERSGGSGDRRILGRLER